MYRARGREKAVKWKKGGMLMRLTCKETRMNYNKDTRCVETQPRDRQRRKKITANQHANRATIALRRVGRERGVSGEYNTRKFAVHELFSHEGVIDDEGKKDRAEPEMCATYICE